MEYRCDVTGGALCAFNTLLKAAVMSAMIFYLGARVLFDIHFSSSHVNITVREHYSRLRSWNLSGSWRLSPRYRDIRRSRHRAGLQSEPEYTNPRLTAPWFEGMIMNENLACDDKHVVCLPDRTS